MPSPLRKMPTDSGHVGGAEETPPQMLFFKAETGNAFTTVLAGLALTITTFPKTSLLPALVAGFKRVLIMHKPGSTNLPTFFTCCAPIAAKLFTAFAHTAFFKSVLSESA